MIGAGLMLVCIAAAAFLTWEAWQGWQWHHRGAGERKARAEYARMRREQADTAEARLSEAEFVRYHVASHPGAIRYVAAALVMLLLALSAFWALLTGWPWN